MSAAFFKKITALFSGSLWLIRVCVTFVQANAIVKVKLATNQISLRLMSAALLGKADAEATEVFQSLFYIESVVLLDILARPLIFEMCNVPLIAKVVDVDISLSAHRNASNYFSRKKATLAKYVL